MHVYGLLRASESTLNVMLQKGEEIHILFTGGGGATKGERLLSGLPDFSC